MISSRETTNYCRSIDVRRWAREGMLCPGYAGSWQWSRDGEVVASIGYRAETGRVVLLYRHRQRGGEWEDVEEPVSLDTTPCRYGGSRTWFLCPAAGCGRRVAILYNARRYFLCRHCYCLAYESQREDEGDRALRKAQTIRKRLGGSANMTMPFPMKPKWMRWHTYEHLREKAEALTQKSLIAVAHRFKLFERGGGCCARG